MESEDAFFILSQITRFGSVLIILFFVGVLVSFMRYLLKLAAFYNSRASVIAILAKVPDLDAEKLEKVVNSFAAEKVEFGEKTKPPTQYMVDLLKALKGQA